VPGVTSAVAVPAVAGIPVTHRGIAHEFTVVSGHVSPDSPQSLVDWSALARMRGTVVVLMGLRHLDGIATVLVRNGRDPFTPAAVVQEGTTGAQKLVRSRLAEVAADAEKADLRPPAIVVIGEVVNALNPGDRAHRGATEPDEPRI
jgi:uroporphyrin-III C-methyltransferase/precorrin-2 dehydrogenase/sirohydrochlorin ferrochelatase